MARGPSRRQLLRALLGCLAGCLGLRSLSAVPPPPPEPRPLPPIAPLGASCAYDVGGGPVTCWGGPGTFRGPGRVEEWRGGVGVALRVDWPFRLPVPE